MFSKIESIEYFLPPKKNLDKKKLIKFIQKQEF